MIVPGCGPCGIPRGCKVIEPALDAAARSEISADVKQNLVGFDVVMHPRDLDRFGMRIEKARRERADDIAANLKGLMDRRRLMDRAGDRLEILRVECERIDDSHPSRRRIERMMRQRHARQARAIFHQNIRRLPLCRS